MLKFARELKVTAVVSGGAAGGATGAAALYRRTMIDDISVRGEFFDESFFAYREDADLAWRAQLMGWKCLYVPTAVAWHVRRVTPERRRQLPHLINWHSIKNRFLMRIKNMSGNLYRKNFFSILARDVVVIGCCLLREQTSLKAFWFLARNWKSVWKKRQEIMKRRRVDDEVGELLHAARAARHRAAGTGPWVCSGKTGSRQRSKPQPRTGPQRPPWCAAALVRCFRPGAHPPWERTWWLSSEFSRAGWVVKVC